MSAGIKLTTLDENESSHLVQVVTVKANNIVIEIYLFHSYLIRSWRDMTRHITLIYL